MGLPYRVVYEISRTAHCGIADHQSSFSKSGLKQIMKLQSQISNVGFFRTATAAKVFGFLRAKSIDPGKDDGAVMVVVVIWIQPYEVDINGIRKGIERRWSFEQDDIQYDGMTAPK